MDNIPISWNISSDCIPMIWNTDHKHFPPEIWNLSHVRPERWSISALLPAAWADVPSAKQIWNHIQNAVPGWTHVHPQTGASPDPVNTASAPHPFQAADSDTVSTGIPAPPISEPVLNAGAQSSVSETASDIPVSDLQQTDSVKQETAVRHDASASMPVSSNSFSASTSDSRQVRQASSRILEPEDDSGYVSILSAPPSMAYPPHSPVHNGSGNAGKIVLIAGCVLGTFLIVAVSGYIGVKLALKGNDSEPDRVAELETTQAAKNQTTATELSSDTVVNHDAAQMTSSVTAASDAAKSFDEYLGEWHDGFHCGIEISKLVGGNDADYYVVIHASQGASESYEYTYSCVGSDDGTYLECNGGGTQTLVLWYESGVEERTVVDSNGKAKFNIKGDTLYWDDDAQTGFTKTDARPVVYATISSARIVGEYMDGGDGYLFRLDVTGNYSYWKADVQFNSPEFYTKTVYSHQLTADYPYITAGSAISNLSATVTAYDADRNAGESYSVKWNSNTDIEKVFVPPEISTVNQYGQINSRGANYIYSYSTSYVCNGGAQTMVRDDLENGWHVTAVRCCYSYGLWWYELYDADDGDYYGWVDESFITWGDAGVIQTEPAVTTAAQQSAYQIIGHIGNGFEDGSPYGGMYGHVETDGSKLNLRSQPSTTAEIVAQIPYGESVYIWRVEGISDWYYVGFLAPTEYEMGEWTEGFAYASFIAFDNQ